MKSQLNFKTCFVFDLPLCIMIDVFRLLVHKQDDFLYIYKHCGYEVWLWSLDLPVEYRRCSV